MRALALASLAFSSSVCTVQARDIRPSAPPLNDDSYVEVRLDRDGFYEFSDLGVHPLGGYTIHRFWLPKESPGFQVASIGHPDWLSIHDLSVEILAGATRIDLTGQ